MKKTTEKTLKPDDTELYEIDTGILDFFLRVFILCVVGLTVTALIVNFFNLIMLAIILSVVAGLLLAFTYMIWLLRDLKLSIKLEKLNLKNFGIDILLLAGIYGLIFLILIFGSQIPWFDYYIVNQSEDPYIIYGNTVPNLYLKVTSTIISVLAFFLFTMYFDLKKINNDLTRAHKQKKSPSEIYFLKEEFVGKYSFRILYKIMGFILIIGASMIPYSTEGFLIILPLMLMLFVPFSVVLLIVILIQKSHVKKSIKYEFILENTKICASCNKIALYSASYCGECGKPFESSYQYHETMNKCQNCDSINPRNYKYCLYCGNIIKVKTFEAKRRFGTDTIKRVILRKNR